MFGFYVDKYYTNIRGWQLFFIDFGIYYMTILLHLMCRHRLQSEYKHSKI
jgi:hypothetical protein